MRALIAAVVALSFWMSAAHADPTMETLDIQTASGQHRFQIELVRAQADMEKGLMFRRYLPDDRGMLFDFKKPQSIMMWMKNTYLPLDMVFIDARGRVIRVADHTEPMSESIIPSGGPALGVLEVNAGVAEKIGLKPGDVVRATIFPK